MKNLPSEKVKELKINFPPAPKPAGVYKPVLVVGKFLYVFGVLLKWIESYKMNLETI